MKRARAIWTTKGDYIVFVGNYRLDDESGEARRFKTAEEGEAAGEIAALPPVPVPVRTKSKRPRPFIVQAIVWVAVVAWESVFVRRFKWPEPPFVASGERLLCTRQPSDYVYDVFGRGRK